MRTCYAVHVKTVTATSLRKSLFRIFEQVAKSAPILVNYKHGDTVIISYHQYLNLLQRLKNSGKKTKMLAPLIKGQIIEPLTQKTDDDLMAYMGLE